MIRNTQGGSPTMFPFSRPRSSSRKSMGRSSRSHTGTSAASRSRRSGRVAEPIPETCWAEARVIAWGEALIVHLNTVIERLGIGDDRPCVPGCVQELPHEVVLTDRFGTGQIHRAVQRLSE